MTAAGDREAGREIREHRVIEIPGFFDEGARDAYVAKFKPEELGALNRHAVMHGESLDYDTRENSLKALSLLNYLALPPSEYSLLDPKQIERISADEFRYMCA